MALVDQRVVLRLNQPLRVERLVVDTVVRLVTQDETLLARELISLSTGRLAPPASSADTADVVHEVACALVWLAICNAPRSTGVVSAPDGGLIPSVLRDVAWIG